MPAADPAALVNLYIKGLEMAKKRMPETIEMRSLFDSALDTQYTKIATKATKAAWFHVIAI